MLYFEHGLLVCDGQLEVIDTPSFGVHVVLAGKFVGPSPVCVLGIGLHLERGA